MHLARAPHSLGVRSGAALLPAFECAHVGGVGSEQTRRRIEPGSLCAEVQAPSTLPPITIRPSRAAASLKRRSRHTNSLLIASARATTIAAASCSASAARSGCIRRRRCALPARAIVPARHSCHRATYAVLAQGGQAPIHIRPECPTIQASADRPRATPASGSCWVAAQAAVRAPSYPKNALRYRPSSRSAKSAPRMSAFAFGIAGNFLRSPFVVVLPRFTSPERSSSARREDSPINCGGSGVS